MGLRGGFWAIQEVTENQTPPQPTPTHPLKKEALSPSSHPGPERRRLRLEVRMARRRLCSAALILLIALAAMPAGAAQQMRVQTARDAWSWLTQLWRVAIERVVPVAWLEKLGPGMDPDGLSGTPDPRPDLGPEMDPNGAK
jgi:hypothetical protein